MRLLTFLLGILVLAACVSAPLPALDVNAPFSSHMMRHTSLMLVAAPLLLFGIRPGRFSRRHLTGFSRLTARIPFACWLTGIFVMWIGHVPAIYNNTTDWHTGMVLCAPLGPFLTTHLVSGVSLSPSWTIADRILPLFYDVSLLIAGFLFWWPVITPCRHYRIPPLRAVVYLASACICCSLLGLLISFAHPGLYRGINLTDQQIGGMIMWVPCCFVYLTACMGLLIEWLSKKEADNTISLQNTQA